MSFILSSIKFLFFKDSFLIKFINPVFKPEKLKFKFSTLGLVNVNALGSPSLESLSIIGPEG